MNENDLRDCFAMFTLCGIVMRGIGDDILEEVASNAYKMADVMLEARKKHYWVEPDGGIAAVAKRSYRRKKDETTEESTRDSTKDKENTTSDA